MLGKVGKVGKSPQSLRSMSETPTVRDAPCPLFYQPPNNVCHFAHFAHFDFPQGEGWKEKVAPGGLDADIRRHDVGSPEFLELSDADYFTGVSTKNHGQSECRGLPGDTGTALPGEHRQLLVHHHAGPRVVGPEFRHLQAVPVAIPVSLHSIAVAAQQLQVPLLRLPVVGQGEDVIHLEAQEVGQVYAAARAYAPLHRVEGDPGRVGNVVAPSTPTPLPGRALLVDLLGLEVFLDEGHVHGPVELVKGRLYPRA